jgi:TolB-like protein
MRRWSGLVVALGLLVAVRAGAEAPATLAVLPLEQGAASEAYQGLGTALAGMLVTDLSGMPELTLVERQRLDALMGELKLAEGKFLDAKTAQKLGRGLGARYVVTGSYSVVGPKFLLDARVVEVETGRILQAASSHGTVDDFVAVEKDLVEDLLQGLSVKLSSADRRKLYVQAPTEKFEAFSAYGEGLARQRKGDMVAAQRAFERALAVDPRFEGARTALASMQSTVATARAAQRAEEVRYRDAAHGKVLDAYPSELIRPAGQVDDADALAGLALRWMVLENEDRHCERLEELMHYLERVDWQVRLPGRTPGGQTLQQRVDAAAEAHGFDRLSSEVATTEAARQSPRARLGILESTYAFIVGGDRARPHSESSGVIGAIQGCLAPAEQLTRLDALLARAKAKEVDFRFGTGSGNFDLGTSISLYWCWVHAKHLGASAALSKRTEGLLKQVEDDKDAKKELLGLVEHMLQLAGLFEMHQLRRLGQPQAALVRAMEGLAAGDAAVVRAEGPYCGHLVKTLQPQAKAWTKRWEKAKSPFDVDFALDQAGPNVGALEAMGCLVGRPGRFKDAAELHHLLSDIGRYARPDKRDDDACIAAFQSAETIASPMMAQQLEQTPSVGPALAHGYLMTLYASLVGQGCVRLGDL